MAAIRKRRLRASYRLVEVHRVVAKNIHVNVEPMNRYNNWLCKGSFNLWFYVCGEVSYVMAAQQVLTFLVHETMFLLCEG